ncbi:GTPase [Trema orientale]|uniref:GTPase n=1 Tax=Trema orientale TaxID=63057 RepID=A0A2P5F6K7_TREOI|nr:GTPase [Trema orientale]
MSLEESKLRLGYRVHRQNPELDFSFGGERKKGYLVGVERKGDIEYAFSIDESLKELGQLADTAGLMVDILTSPNPRTYIGSGKVAEIKSAIHALGVETGIFDYALSAGRLRNWRSVLVEM